MLALMPCLFLRLYQAFSSKKWENAWIDLCEDLSIASQTFLLISFVPKLFFIWPFLLAYQLIGWFCAYRLEIPLTPSVWHYALHPSSFSDSIRYLKIPQQAAIGLGLILLSLLGLFEELSFKFWLPFFLVSSAAAVAGRPLADGRRAENPLFQAQWGWLFKKQKTSGAFSWNFPTEVCRFLSPEYPLLRKTISFTGSKLFDIAPGEKPHIIFLFLESFRSMNVGCMGAEIPATPCFDRLAEQGILFPNFYAIGPQTSRTFLASLFGIAPHLDTPNLQPYCKFPLIGLPEILREKNYKTALIQGGSVLVDNTSQFSKCHGFETVLGKEDIPATREQMMSWGIHDGPLLQYAADWLRTQTAPTFLSLFTISNHHPWEPPQNWHFPVSKDLPEPYRRYLQTFSYSDFALGQFVEKLQQTGLMDRSLLFICGDHGQEMGEKGPNFAVHNSLYQGNLHIPLLLLGRGIQPRKIETPSSHADFLPTVLDLLGIQAVHHSVGKSLARAQSNASLYFSLPGNFSHLGCLKGSHKLISTGKKIELYDLSKDPLEKTNLAPSPLAAQLEEETIAFFDAMDTLYTNKAWMPASYQKTPYELKPPLHATDAIWAQYLAGQPPAPVMNLSQSNLTHRAIEAIGKEKGFDLIELNISHSFFTDHSLEWISGHCPHLTMLNASHCPLLTDLGVSQILQKCTQLRYLSLENIDELSNLCEPSSSLKALFLKESHNVLGESLIRLSSHLIFLAASLEKTEKFHLAQIGKNLLYTWFTDGIAIDDETFARFCINNPSLEYLVLEHFPLLEAFPFIPRLKWLKIESCDNLTDKALEILSKHPLKELTLINCPKLTGKGLAHFLAIPACKIILSECTGIDAQAILDLRAQGMNIY